MTINARFKSVFRASLEEFFGSSAVLSAAAVQKGPVLAVLESVSDLDFETAVTKFTASIDSQKAAQRINATVAYRAKNLFFETGATLGIITTAEKIKRQAALRM